MRTLTGLIPVGANLSSMIRNDNLAPDWERVGTDITHQGPFNASFSLTGVSGVPLPAALPLFATGLGALGLLDWRRKRKAAALAT